MTTADYEVGATATITIGTPDGAGDTTLDLTVTSGRTQTVTNPTATPNVGHTEWTLELVLDEPGDWTIVAVADGTGANEASYTLHVAPQPPPSTGMYANTGDWAAYTGEAPKAGLPKLMRRATLDVRRVTKCAVYEVDDDKLPTDADLLQALQDAVCEQASYCIDSGRAKGIVSPTTSFSLGKLSRSTGGGASAGSASGPDFSPHAYTILDDAGLTGWGPIN